MTIDDAPADDAGDSPRSVIRVENLVKHFPVKGGRGAVVHAVDDVSFTVPEGKTVGLVGESGCGKSTVARSIMRVHEPDSGRIWIDDTDITHLSTRQLRPIRRRLQMVFQDPYASLNARMTVRDIIAEPLIAHRIGRAGMAREQLIKDMLDRVGLLPSHANRYPHEFSGGQRQRIGIARALISEPTAVVCDEPISALDVSIQAQVVNLLRDIQAERGISYLFIAHDLSMVRFVSDEIIVMYLGNVMEQANADALYRTPLHPYTRGLIDSVPGKRRAGSDTVSVEGDVPSPINPPSGCRFRTRCPFAMPICAEVKPPLVEVLPGHQVACHLYPEPLDPAGATPPVLPPAPSTKEPV